MRPLSLRKTVGQDLTESPRQIAHLQRSLLSWYKRNARALPWREDRDPYRVWVSEVMLQQTRVAAVIGHYQRFLRRFPDIYKLAAAREASVLAAWSGLGYYRRARMMHAAAKEIVKHQRGQFPGDAKSLQLLPGIGRYTAAAIASIAFAEPIALVDGNVGRVIGRLLGKSTTGEALWKHAQTLLFCDDPGNFNQAMMELGATICLPNAPNCPICPLVDFCVTQAALPSPQRQPRHKREVHYALQVHDDSVFLVKRPRTDALLAGMWELPKFEGRELNIWKTFRHSITVTDYLVRVHREVNPELPPAGKSIGNEQPGEFVAVARLSKLPLTGLARKVLQAACLL